MLASLLIEFGKDFLGATEGFHPGRNACINRRLDEYFANFFLAYAIGQGSTDMEFQFMSATER